MNSNSSFHTVAGATILIMFFMLMNSEKLHSQENPLVVLNSGGVSAILSGIPSYVKEQGDVTLYLNNRNAENIEFSNWILAERYGDYNLTLGISWGSGTVIQVLYHKDYGTAEETTTIVGSAACFNLSCSFAGAIIELDLDELDGTQMGVLEIQYLRGVTLQLQEISLIPIVVTGVRSAELPALGSMVTPQIPHIILHDPPGDGSFSTFKSGQKVCRETSTSFQQETGVGISLALKAGIQGEVGASAGISVAVPFETSVEVTAGLNISETTLTETSTERCLEVTSEFNTSDLPGVSGEDADVFIGYGETWLYGIYEEVEVPSLMEIEQGEDTARINKGLAYARDDSPGSTTTFILTPSGIQNDIDNQMGIANNPANSLLTRTRAINQVNVWQDVLDRNEANLASANVKIDDYLFSGTTSSSFDEKITVTDVTSISVDVALETSAGINTVAMVGGNGVTGGLQINFNVNEGATTTDSEESSKLVGYTLEDDDVSDLFRVAAIRDPTYGTPIFKFETGTRSSCPYEGGYQIDQPSLLSEDIRICNDASVKTQYIQTTNLNDPVNIRLDVCNDSEEDRTYLLELTNNANNGIVELNGETLGGVNDLISYTVPANSCWVDDPNNEKPLLTITRNSNSNVDELNLGFNLFPECGFKDEGSKMALDITFGKPNPKADIDCDGCAQEVVLNSLSGSLNGTYVSEQKIIVQPDAQFEIGGDVTLDAPEVELMMSNSIPNSTSLSVASEGCNED